MTIDKELTRMTDTDMQPPLQDDTQERIMNEFSRMRETYRRMQDDLTGILGAMLKRENISISTLAIRIKEKEALRRKIIYKRKYQKLSDITDVIGCRIITLFEDDVERVFALVQREFEVVEVVDHRRKMQETTEFGYNSLHVIVRFSPVRLQLTEYAAYADVKFEIQIRSALQHAWAEVEHGLGYKNEYEVPRTVRRRLSRLSASLELLDEEFMHIRDEIERYNQSIDRVEHVMRTDVNLNSLMRYIDGSAEIRSIADTLAGEFHIPVVEDSEILTRQKLPEKLAFLGIKTIGEVDEIVRTRRDTLLALGRQFIAISESRSVNVYAVLLYVLAAATMREVQGGEQMPERNLIDVIYRIEELVKRSRAGAEARALPEDTQDKA